MKWKNILFAIACIISILILSKLIPNSKKVSSTVNYAPDGFKETIAARINGIVTETKQSGLFWVTINQRELPFSYETAKLPDDWLKTYPKPFIIVGDSVYKNANNDTFFLVRGNKTWLYCLPK